MLGRGSSYSKTRVPGAGEVTKRVNIDKQKRPEVYLTVFKSVVVIEMYSAWCLGLTQLKSEICMDLPLCVISYIAALSCP